MHAISCPLLFLCSLFCGAAVWMCVRRNFVMRCNFVAAVVAFSGIFACFVVRFKFDVVCNNYYVALRCEKLLIAK